MEEQGLLQQARLYNMLSIQEKQKVINTRIKAYKDEIHKLYSDSSLLTEGDPQISINASEYSNLINYVKALHNELSLLTNNNQ